MIIFILFLLTANGCATPGTYECGLHGRFEYCIDGFPGCVVGCHCYPGYYFDTDSKICEPNTRLTQDFRRNLAPSYSLPMGISRGLQVPPSVDTSHLLDASTRDAQDNSEISDWLYNQFFKTIENGIINKTDDDDLKATRRSGAPIEPLISRKYRKKKSRYGRKRDSRKKHTRLRADDTDSSSSSDSSDSSSDSSSSDLGSWERYEWSPQPNPDQPKDDAAQRQIVVYSKKPKPPLPSFIFLPNMQTPFFPPIGLPAPAMPLYPMVPVPPIPLVTDCTERESATPTATTLETTTSGMSDTTMTSTSTTTTTMTTTTTTTTPAPTSTSTPAPSEEKTTDQNQALRYGYHRPKNRNKPQPHTVYKPPKDIFSQYQDGDSDAMFLGDTHSPFFEDDLNMDKVDEPDFKYLSQLIHKDFNATTTKRPPWKGINFKKQPTPHSDDKSPTPYFPKRRQRIKPGRLNDLTRRRFDPETNGQDDSYYSTLGRQIAKLIRGIENQGIGEADLKLEPEKDIKVTHPFFGESTFSARSYWERFVRSPLSVRLQNFTKYDNLIAGNEQLFNLENKVQEATSPPPLSLIELENVINTMGTMQSQINNKKLGNNSDKPSNRSLNISLLPKYSKHRIEEQQEPKIKMNDRKLALHTARKVADVFTNSNLKQKLIGIIPNKPKLSTIKQPNNVNDKSERVYAYIQRPKKLHSIITTMPPTPKSSAPLVKNIENSGRGLINQNNFEKYYFNNRSKKDRIIFVAGSDFVHSKRYFFEPNMNYQFEN